MPAVDAEKALDRFRVIDLSESDAGQFCRMLADYGASVTLIEPPDGSAVRRMRPPEGLNGAASESYLFEHLNIGKTSLILDQATVEGRDRLVRLAADADVLVAPGGIDRAHLHEANPNLIVAIVSPFGEDGPKRDWRDTELIYQALSGSMIQPGGRPTLASGITVPFPKDACHAPTCRTVPR